MTSLLSAGSPASAITKGRRVWFSKTYRGSMYCSISRVIFLREIDRFEAIRKTFVGLVDCSIAFNIHVLNENQICPRYTIGFGIINVCAYSVFLVVLMFVIRISMSVYIVCFWLC